jgi:hypothetical protein
MSAELTFNYHVVQTNYQWSELSFLSPTCYQCEAFRRVCQESVPDKIRDSLFATNSETIVPSIGYKWFLLRMTKLTAQLPLPYCRGYDGELHFHSILRIHDSFLGNGTNLPFTLIG